jgi:hypothetical protein
LTPEVQRLLATDEDEFVRSKLTYREDLLPELQLFLAADLSHEVRECLALRETTASQAQFLLARDRSVTVREYLAANASLTPEAQHLLMVDEDSLVRCALVRNKTVRLTEDFTLSVLESCSRGREFVAAVLARRVVSEEDLSVLLNNWSGTLKELLETAEELATDPSST